MVCAGGPVETRLGIDTGPGGTVNDRVKLVARPNDLQRRETPIGS